MLSKCLRATAAGVCLALTLTGTRPASADQILVCRSGKGMRLWTLTSLLWRTLCIVYEDLPCYSGNLVNVWDLQRTFLTFTFVANPTPALVSLPAEGECAFRYSAMRTNA